MVLILTKFVTVCVHFLLYFDITWTMAQSILSTHNEKILVSLIDMCSMGGGGGEFRDMGVVWHMPQVPLEKR